MPGDMADMSLMDFDYPQDQEFTFNEPTVPEPVKHEPVITMSNGVNYYVNDEYMSNGLANVSLMDFGYPEDQELNQNDLAGLVEPGPAEPELPRVEPIARYFFFLINTKLFCVVS